MTRAKTFCATASVLGPFSHDAETMSDPGAGCTTVAFD
jgi:hypothetical protein